MPIHLFYPKCNTLYSVQVAQSHWRSFGQSKRENWDVHKVFSYSTDNRYSGIVRDFALFCKEEGANRIDRITPQIIDKYFESKKGKDGRPPSEKTIKVNISALKKYFHTIAQNTNYENLKTHCENLLKHIEDKRDYYLSFSRPSSSVQVLLNPERIIQNLKDPLHQSMAICQLLTGARVGDLKKMEIEGNKVIIVGSKGGRDREFTIPHKEAQIAKYHLDKIKSAINVGKWGTLRKTYSQDCKTTANNLKEPFISPHDFRATFADRYLNYLNSHPTANQERQITLDKTYSHKEYARREFSHSQEAQQALQENWYGTYIINYQDTEGKTHSITVDMKELATSKALGHNRPEITKGYTK